MKSTLYLWDKVQGKAELVLRSKGRRGVDPERISANLSPTISSQPVGYGLRAHGGENTDRW